MARPGFYNDNENRAYPFLDADGLTTFGLPSSTVVDSGFLIGPQSGYLAGTHTVHLAEVMRSGTTLTFYFETTAPGLVNGRLEFTRDVTDAPYTSSYADVADSQVLSDSSFSSECPSAISDAFSGYLVTGDLADLLVLLPGDGSLTGTALVEPATCRELGGSYARSVNIANADRTRYATPDGCKDQCWPGNVDPLYVRDTCLSGIIRFKEGYNSAIRQNTRENSLTFGARVGSGAGEACEQVPLYDTEAAPKDSLWLEGGPACNDVIRSINGVGGRVFNIKGGPGTTVTPYPGEARIEINVDMHDMATCGQDDGLDNITCPENSLSTSASECECGPA